MNMLNNFFKHFPKINLLISGMLFYNIELLPSVQVSFKFIFRSTRQILINFNFPDSHQIAASSRSPQRRGPKRRQTEDESAGPSLPKRVSAERETMHRSDNSKSATLNVEDVPFAEMLIKKSKRIQKSEDMDLYGVPLSRSSTVIGPATIHHFVFNVDENDPTLDKIKENKTILFVGAPDSLINNLFNFIVGVDRNDRFRFILGENDQQEETQSISVYEIHHVDGFRIPLSLVIVSVPFCVEKPCKDFAEMLSNLLESDTIQKLDLIGFVAQENSIPTPSSKSILSHFGMDLAENVHYIVEPESNILDSVPRLKFQNLKFPADDHNPRSLERSPWKSYKDFFISLAKMYPNGLSQTRQVLKERKRLEVTFSELRKYVDVGKTLRDEMEKTKKMIADYQVEMEDNIYDIKITRKTNLKAGYVATNCKKCSATCYVHLKSERPLVFVSCSKCPEKCSRDLHFVESYGLESTVRKIPSKAEAQENQRKLVLEERENSIEQKALRSRVNVYIEALDKIALYPFPMTPEYADLMA